MDTIPNNSKACYFKSGEKKLQGNTIIKINFIHNPQKTKTKKPLVILQKWI